MTAAYDYDNNGNLKSTTRKVDGNLGNDEVSAYDYDALNRLAKLTDALSGLTQYGYDGLDHLTAVRDPRNLATSYSVDGLDNTKQTISPDTGTSSNTYDAAGNLKTATDARGKVATYSYDALNRVTGITFNDTTPAITFTYDSTVNANKGIGHLTKLTDGTGATERLYDIQGRVMQKKQTTATLIQTMGYAYDTFGRLASMTYPVEHTKRRDVRAYEQVSCNCNGRERDYLQKNLTGNES